MKTADTHEPVTLEAITKITSKGQVTVPAEFRQALGVKEGDQLRFILRNGVGYVEPVRYPSSSEIFGMFDHPEDDGHFVLDLDGAREERAETLLRKTD